MHARFISNAALGFLWNGSLCPDPLLVVSTGSPPPLASPMRHASLFSPGQRMETRYKMRAKIRMPRFGWISKGSSNHPCLRFVLSKPFSLKGCTLFVITETPPRSLPLRKLMHIGEKSMNETRVCHDNRGQKRTPLVYLSSFI